MDDHILNSKLAAVFLCLQLTAGTDTYANDTLYKSVELSKKKKAAIISAHFDC